MHIDWNTDKEFDWFVGGTNKQVVDPYIGTKPGVTLRVVNSIVPLEVKKAGGGWTHYRAKGTFNAGTQKNPGVTGVNFAKWNDGDKIMTAVLDGDLSGQTDAKEGVASAVNGNPLVDAAGYHYGGMQFGNLAGPPTDA
jgi:hypothetical protein